MLFLFFILRSYPEGELADRSWQAMVMGRKQSISAGNFKTPACGDNGAIQHSISAKYAPALRRASHRKFKAI
jgi:hypothetical protein